MLSSKRINVNGEKSIMEEPTTNQNPGAEESSSVEYPDDGWLRGYFLDMRNDVKGGRVSPTGHKNLDFMRLRDRGLHLLGRSGGTKSGIGGPHRLSSFSL